MNKLYFMGDSHGKWQSFEDLIITQNIRDAYIWHVGDGVFGLGERKTDMIIMTKLNDFLISKKINLLNTRGNHENPYWFKSKTSLLKYLKLEDKQVPNWKKEDYYYKYYYVDPIEFSQFIKNLSNIKFVQDYDVIKLNNLNILSIGGAISIDRKYQNIYNSYFPNEKISYNDKIKTMENIDIIVSHNIPDFVEPIGFNSLVHKFAENDKNLLHDLSEERKLMTKIYNEIIKKNTDISFWIHGHYHKHLVKNINNINFCCLGLLELCEIK